MTLDSDRLHAEREAVRQQILTALVAERDSCREDQEWDRARQWTYAASLVRNMRLDTVARDL